MINTKHRIEFYPEKCVGCQQCYKACFVDVIRWDAEKSSRSSNTWKTASAASSASSCAKRMR